MPKKIHKLTVRADPDFRLIGISSTDNDYHLSWNLNHSLDMKFIKTENLEVYHKRLGGMQAFSQFRYHDENSLVHYRLLANRSEHGSLIEEVTNVDYILQISGELDGFAVEDLIRSLGQVTGIRLAVRIEPGKLKSAWKLAF